MADMAPSSSVTKFGSILVIFVIAIVALWAANNVGFLTKLVSKRIITAA